MRTVVAAALLALAACPKQEQAKTSPQPAAPAAAPPPASVAAENHVDDHDDHGDHGEDDGKDHRALYVDRVAIEFRNLVVDAAGALDDGKGAPFDNAAGKLPATTTYTSIKVEGGGVLVGGKDGSLWYSANGSDAYVVVRDPRE